MNGDWPNEIQFGSHEGNRLWKSAANLAAVAVQRVTGTSAETTRFRPRITAMPQPPRTFKTTPQHAAASAQMQALVSLLENEEQPMIVLDLHYST